MKMPSKHTLKDMTSIQLEFERRFAKLPGIIGVGLGKDRSGEYEIKVYVVDATASKTLPEKFRDAHVSVEISGSVSAH